ncbi:hypothetical protein EGN72_10070 [Pseudorhodobacter sp. E13]|nr:hypothetical protein EGN72_10070 [Pseudorhodobacter sp. E13]
MKLAPARWAKLLLGRWRAGNTLFPVCRVLRGLGQKFPEFGPKRGRGGVLGGLVGGVLRQQMACHGHGLDGLAGRMW